MDLGSPRGYGVRQGPRAGTERLSIDEQTVCLLPVTTLSFEIPDEILSDLQLPEGEEEKELKKDLAVALYARGALSFAQARSLTDLSRREFDALLGERRAPRRYDDEDLSGDLAYAGGD